MPYYDNYIKAPASSTDNAPVRFDGTTGMLAQNSDSTLDDTEILILPDAAGALVAGSTVTSVVVAGVTLTPAALLHTSLGTRPNLIMLRSADTGATNAPTFNFVRSRGTPGAEAVVGSADSLGIISFVGHDGTDYAAAAQIDCVTDGTIGSNDMPGRIRFLVSLDGTQSPALALTIQNDKSLLLAATAVIQIPNTGLKVFDTDSSHYLTIAPGSNLTAARTLTVTTGDADRTLTLPLYFGIMIVAGANTGTVTTGTPTYMTGGGATASVGITLGKAVHLTRMSVNFAVAAATTSGSVTARFTLFKNANSGTSARVFQVTFTSVTTGTGRLGSSTTIVDAGTDAINGTTDYLVLAVEVTASTSCSLTGLDVLLEGTCDA